jgi:DNA-binding CsgD family transcriptional regulator
MLPPGPEFARTSVAARAVDGSARTANSSSVSKPLDFVTAIETAYDDVADDAVWLAQLVRLVGPVFGPGLSATSAYFFDLCRTTGVQLSHFASVGAKPYTREHYEKHHAAATAVEQRQSYECDMFTLLSRVLGEERFQHIVGVSGMRGDGCLGLRANVTPYNGILITTFVPRGYRIRQRRLWTRLAAHVGSAARLRRNKRTPAPDAALAVLTPGGKLEHGTTETIAARADLSTAAQSIDRARGKMRRIDPEAATALWRTMVRGEWSLVDWFDHDGKRFLLAQDNRVATAPRQHLTEREHQVVACAAMGHSNKLIAYDLGLSPGTVAVILSRAAKKLGVSSRPALIRAFRETPGTAAVGPDGS